MEQREVALGCKWTVMPNQTAQQENILSTT